MTFNHPFYAVYLGRVTNRAGRTEISLRDSALILTTKDGHEYLIQWQRDPYPKRFDTYPELVEYLRKQGDAGPNTLTKLNHVVVEQGWVSEEPA